MGTLAQLCEERIHVGQGYAPLRVPWTKAIVKSQFVLAFAIKASGREKYENMIEHDRTAINCHVQSDEYMLNHVHIREAVSLC